MSDSLKLGSLRWNLFVCSSTDNERQDWHQKGAMSQYLIWVSSSLFWAIDADAAHQEIHDGANNLVG